MSRRGSQFIEKVEQGIFRRTLFPYRHLTVKSDRRLSSWAGVLREGRGDWCSLYTQNPYPPTFTLLFQDVHTGYSLIRIAAPGVSGSTILSGYAFMKTRPCKYCRFLSYDFLVSPCASCAISSKDYKYINRILNWTDKCSKCFVTATLVTRLCVAIFKWRKKGTCKWKERCSDKGNVALLYPYCINHCRRKKKNKENERSLDGRICKSRNGLKKCLTIKRRWNDVQLSAIS